MNTLCMVVQLAVCLEFLHLFNKLEGRNLNLIKIDVLECKEIYLLTNRVCISGVVHCYFNYMLDIHIILNILSPNMEEQYTEDFMVCLAIHYYLCLENLF